MLLWEPVGEKEPKKGCGNNFLIHASGQRLESVNYTWCLSHLPWGAFMREAIREMEWTAADDFNIARCHCPPLDMTAARHIMNCVRQKQQLDALALFIDFAAAHTNPTPSGPRQIQRKHVCTTWQLPHWFCFWRDRDLLFADLVCRACAQTLAKRLTLTSRTFVYSWTGAIFIRAVCIKRAYLATDVLLWICGPLESRCQKKRMPAPCEGLLSLSQKTWEGSEFPLSRSMDHGNCQRYLGARAMSSLFFPKPLSLAKQQPADCGSRWSGGSRGRVFVRVGVVFQTSTLLKRLWVLTVFMIISKSNIASYKIKTISHTASCLWLEKQCVLFENHVLLKLHPSHWDAEEYRL